MSLWIWSTYWILLQTVFIVSERELILEMEAMCVQVKWLPRVYMEDTSLSVSFALLRFCINMCTYRRMGCVRHYYIARTEMSSVHFTEQLKCFKIHWVDDTAIALSFSLSLRMTGNINSHICAGECLLNCTERPITIVQSHFDCFWVSVRDRILYNFFDLSYMLTGKLKCRKLI